MKMDRRTFFKGGALAAGTIAVTGLASGCAPASKAESEPLAASGADSAPDWLGSAPSISDEDCDEVLETSVLVIGAGMSGYFAACAAAEAGADTLLIEKGERGSGVRCSAIGAVGSSLQKEHGVEIDKMEIMNDFAHYAHNHCAIEQTRQWVENSGEAVDWYRDLIEQAGLFVELEYNMPPQETVYKMWPVGHGTVAELNTPGHLGGASEVEGRMQEALLAYFEQCGGRSSFNTVMECLILNDSGNVVGAYATRSDGSTVRINASAGVIVATGGYASNEAMMDALQPEFKKSLAGLFAFPTATGDGIKAVLWAGGELTRHPANCLFGRGAVPPDYAIGEPFNDTTSEYFSFGEQPFLKVGKNGQRLCNESAPYLFVMNAAAQKCPEDRAWYEIWDSNWADDVARFHTIACSTLIMREGGNHDPDEYMSIEVVSEVIEDLVSRGFIMRADTVEELGEMLQLDDADTFVATVARYNELFDAQLDEDFGKDPFRLSAIRQPPFYGVKLGGKQLATLHGVRVNDKFQALRSDNTPIEGLYVIGNDQGGMFAHVYPNFAAGVNAGRCATFGRMVGKALAQA